MFDKDFADGQDPSNIKGKDYDHKTKKFISVKANRGNRGHGTRNE